MLLLPNLFILLPNFVLLLWHITANNYDAVFKGWGWYWFH